MQQLATRTLALLVALWITLTAAATDYPLTATDDLGREVTLAAAPQRVVTLVPSLTESVCAIDACDLLVGVDEHSNHPASAIADLPRVGNGFQPNIEAIVALEPDLVLVEETTGAAEQLAALGLTVYAGTPQSLEETFQALETLGWLLDREEAAAAEVARLRAELDEITALLAGAGTPSVYLELDPTPFSVGPGSYLGELITLAGGENIVTPDLGQFPQLAPEFIVAADPQVIILTDAPFGESAETVAARPGWASIRAVQAGRVAELTGEQVDALSRPGPRLAEALRILVGIIHPDLLP